MSREHKEMVSSLFKRTGFTSDTNAALHAVVGICGEAGELLDAVKKSWAYGKPLDFDNLVEELGDIEFYLEALRQEYGISRKEILQANIDKLGKRFPQGTYSDKDAVSRKDKQHPSAD